MSEVLKSVNEEAALEKLHDMGCTDGLPVIIPTQERVDRLVLASGLEADMVLGELGPAMGIATVEKVAISAVMAGCKPDYLPIVVAAVKAAADPQFDLTELPAEYVAVKLYTAASLPDSNESRRLLRALIGRISSVFPVVCVPAMLSVVLCCLAMLRL